MLPPEAAARFEIHARLGSGSFGVVYAAFDHQRQRQVALKVLDGAAPESVVRFKREFRSLAELRHPNLASLYELVLLGEQWSLSMELIRGADLLEHLAFAELQSAMIEARASTSEAFDPDKLILIRRKPKTEGLSRIYVEHVRDTFRQLAVAIAVVHAHGIVHRDIKPANIMITREGRVVLLDFGLVAELSLDDTLDRKAVVGTPGYMSPEQIRIHPTVPASDWYSYGVMLYQALTGQLPFGGQNPAEVIERQLRGEIIPVSRIVPDVPADLAALAEELLALDPSARPGDDDILRRLGVEEPQRRGHPRTAEVIARGREVRRLLNVIEALQPGLPRFIHLHGSPGAGKSAVADRFLDRARHETDALIIGGRCHTWESVPMNAIDSVVDSLVRILRHEAPPAAIEILSRAVALTQLFPALSIVPLAAGEDTIAIPPTGEKLFARAASELAAVLHATAGARPLVIFLDDAQWGDYASAQVFRRLLQSSQPHRVAVIFSFRTEDAPTSLLLQALRGLKVSELLVRDLSRTATTRMLRRSGLRAGRRLLDSVYRYTGGNPAMTGMIIDAMNALAADDRTLFERALSVRLDEVSAAGQRLFAFLLSQEGPVSEEETEAALELFEMDEPLRTLTRERLIRIRLTGDLREFDVYHPRMRTFLP